MKSIALSDKREKYLRPHPTVRLDSAKIELSERQITAETTEETTVKPAKPNTL